MPVVSGTCDFCGAANTDGGPFYLLVARAGSDEGERRIAPTLQGNACRACGARLSTFNRLRLSALLALGAGIAAMLLLMPGAFDYGVVGGLLIGAVAPFVPAAVLFVRLATWHSRAARGLLGDRFPQLLRSGGVELRIFPGKVAGATPLSDVKGSADAVVARPRFSEGDGDRVPPARYAIPSGVETHVALHKTASSELTCVNVLVGGNKLEDVARAARILALRAADENRWDPTFTGKIRILVSARRTPDSDGIRPLMDAAISGARDDLSKKGWTVAGGASFDLGWSFTGDRVD